VAVALGQCIRPMDTVARFGGEEFAMILPNCAPFFAQQVAERIRSHVGSLRIDIAPGERVSVTVSIGGAFAPQWVRSSSLLWVERADQQLYRAKSEGRNRACLEQPIVSQVSAEEKGLLFGTSQFSEL
jgi:diguanylate cyclase (GGDEF)-like protein